jgi:hypothetical protein
LALIYRKVRMMKLTRKRLTAAAGGSALVAAGLVVVPTTLSHAATAHADTSFASVSAAGALARSFPGGVGSSRLQTGDYRVVIPGITASQCATLANTNTDAGDTATALPSSTNIVIVHTYTPAGVWAGQCAALAPHDSLIGIMNTSCLGGRWAG